MYWIFANIAENAPTTAQNTPIDVDVDHHITLTGEAWSAYVVSSIRPEWARVPGTGIAVAIRVKPLAVPVRTACLQKRLLCQIGRRIARAGPFRVRKADG